MTQRKKRLGRGLEALLSGISETGNPAASEEDPRIIPMSEAAEPQSPARAPHSQPTSNSPQQQPTEQVNTNSNSPSPTALGAARTPAPVSSPPTRATSEPSNPSSPVEPTDQLLRLNVEDVDDNPFQPRRDFSEPEIVSLAESLKEHDMLQPILVRRVGERYQLISGERRLRAAIRAGWQTIPAKLRHADDRLVAELAIVENLQRKDLNAIEKAWSFSRYLDEHHCTQDELASRLKIDRSTIANLIRLLELPTIVQEAVRTSVISAGHARALLSLGEESLQIKFCNRIQVEGWSVREAERQTQDYIRSLDGDGIGGDAGRAKKKQKQTSPQLAALEQEFKMALGTKVVINKSSRGKGKITIQFNSVDDFERIRMALCGNMLHPSSRAAS